MFFRRRGEHFHKPIGELDQPAAVVCDDEVCFVALFPLARKDLLEHILLFLGQRTLGRTVRFSSYAVACGKRGGWI